MTPARPRSLFALALASALAFSLLPAASSSAQSADDVPSNAFCDTLDPKLCLLPFPNDFFTVEDTSTATGRRVDLSPLAMPRNGTDFTNGGEGSPIDPTEWNRQDGFSPGSMVMTYVPGIDLHVTWGTQDRPHSQAGLNEPGYFDHRDTIADPSLSLAADAPMVLVNADTGERHPFWSELDTHPDAVDAGEQLLIIRPAVNFDEGARYVIGLRNLKDANGAMIPAGPEFAAYAAGGVDDDRQEHFDNAVFPVLAEEDVDRNELYLAWDFTIASERNLSERILHMRDDAFGRILGDPELADRKVAGSAPEFVVDRTEDRQETWTDSRGVSHVQSVRRVHGRVTVPNYMDRIQQSEAHFKANGETPDKPDGSALPPDLKEYYDEVPNPGGNSYDLPAPGSRLLDIDGDGLPDQNPVESTVRVPFMCDVVVSQDGQNSGPRIPMLYGHGLLGTRDQLGDLRSPRRYGPFMGCAADWWGMSFSDVPTVAEILVDASNFPSLPDRAQQGFLNFMFLGRALVHPDGFASDEAFRNGEAPLIDTDTGDGTKLHYDGNSQGGIMGGSLVAVSPDIHRGILGVPGMNYSTLLNRSVDWEGSYAEVFYAAYQDPVERQVAFTLMQMLWDRGETNGYAHHMTTDPLPNTPPHDVMLQVAWADHQVTNVSAEVEARTIDAPIMTPGLPQGRHWEMAPYFTRTANYPYEGSSLIYWDSGNATPPNGNVPADHDRDPHGHPRSEPAAGWQEAHFLLTGWNVDVCEGQDYLTDDNPAVRDGQRGRCRAPDYPAGSTAPEPTLTPTPTDTPTETPSETPTDPGPSATSLEFTGRSAAAGQYSDRTLFEVELKESETGTPISGANVSFMLTGAEGTRTFDGATTNDAGIATVEPTLTERPGIHQLVVRYEGDAAHQEMANTRDFVVEKEEVAISTALSGKGSKRRIEALLSDPDEDPAAPVTGRTVDFFADGSPIGSDDSDQDGLAWITVPSRFQGGHHDFEAVFAGDDYYQRAAAGSST